MRRGYAAHLPPPTYLHFHEWLSEKQRENAYNSGGTISCTDLITAIYICGQEVVTTPKIASSGNDPPRLVL